MQVAARARTVAFAALAGVALTNPFAPAPAAATHSPADKVVAIATAQLGDPWVWGAAGPYSFDCSGLVIYSFKQAGYGYKIGDGKYRSAYAMYDWFRSRGLATKTGGQRGDVVIYGGGSHAGIYMGDGKVVSTLTSGVRIHGLYAVTAPFTAFLRTGMSSGTVTTSTTTTTTTATTTTYRYTTASLRLRSGPSTAYATLSILPDDSKLKVTKSARDAYGRTWYFVWSYAAAKSGWVAGWYTRAA